MNRSGVRNRLNFITVRSKLLKKLRRRYSIFHCVDRGMWYVYDPKDHYGYVDGECLFYALQDLLSSRYKMAYRMLAEFPNKQEKNKNRRER